jgi:hypothetical protein
MFDIYFNINGVEFIGSFPLETFNPKNLEFIGEIESYLYTGKVDIIEVTNKTSITIKIEEGKIIEFFYPKI